MLFRVTDNVSGLTQQFDLLLLVNAFFSSVTRVLNGTILVVRQFIRLDVDNSGAAVNHSLCLCICRYGGCAEGTIYVIFASIYGEVGDHGFNVKR